MGRRKCECGRAEPSFGLPGEGRKGARWCSRCPGRPEGAVDVVSKRCECGRALPSFGLPGERPNDARWCSGCPEQSEGAVDVVSKRCECGRALPSLGLPGEGRQGARWCARCLERPEGAVNVVSKRCECGRAQPSFGLSGERPNDARWCSGWAAAPDEVEVVPDIAAAASSALFEKTVAAFKKNSIIPKLNNIAQKRYDIFCRNRTGELYMIFFGLVGGGVPDFSEAKLVRHFPACVPFPGKTNERIVDGMATGTDGCVPHGLIRYEFKGCSIEECRVDGREHGLRVVCTQMGDYWIRLYSHGKRLAQIVLSSDCSEGGGPVIDNGGLEMLRNHLNLVCECLRGV